MPAKQNAGEGRTPNPIIVRARAHYGGDLLRELLAVDEWGDLEGVPLRVFAYPLTVYEKQELMNEQRELGTMLASVNLIIRKACDEDGAKLFDVLDRRALQRAVSPVVLERIAGAILATEYAASEDLEKK